MTRRNFIRHMLQSVASASLLGFSGACAARPQVNDSEHSRALAYRPLNGTRMRDLAKRKTHHGQGRYLNPFTNTPKGRLGPLLQWKWFSKNEFKAYYPGEEVTPVTLNHRQLENASDLSITLIKHAGLFIKDRDAYIAIDPVFNGLFWFIEDFSPLAFDAATLPQPKHILITHGHYDHLDTASLRTWGTGTHIICPPGYDELFNDLMMTIKITAITGNINAGPAFGPNDV